MSTNLQLFESKSSPSKPSANSPLADRLRPQVWEDFQGLEQIEPELLSRLKTGQGKPPSLIFWGPPGSGKTTLAKLIGNTFDYNFIEFSAVLGGVKEVREIIKTARQSSRGTILFVDEIHRFNKSQQDAFLPHVENGTIILFGATTENPSFYLNAALISRARVVVLPALNHDSLDNIIGATESELGVEIDQAAKALLIQFVGGDARRLLNLIESYLESHSAEEVTRIEADSLKLFLGNTNSLFYDRDGEEHYNLASAFIKSMRASDPDAALYWGFRMLESGEDPRFLIRRMMIFASEDVGNSDPRALQLAVATSQAFEKLGLPEGRIPIAQCITYLAGAPKSNRSYAAMNKVLDLIRENPVSPVPLHLRNAPTKLMKEIGYGQGYQYPHNYDDGFVDMNNLPDELAGQRFYEPKDAGYEKIIKERLTRRKAD